MSTGGALAFEDGISGRSTTGCDACHSGGATPTVSISGPTSVTVGQTASFSLNVTGGAGVVCGLGVTGALQLEHVVVGSDGRDFAR